MTFSQFEREIVAERIKDKMSAHRRKGMWTGGVIPYGYRPVDRKLQIVDEEAKVIQWMFKRFIEVQSPKQIALELNQRGVLTKKGKQWDRAYISRLMGSPLYIGKIKYEGEIYDGEHKAIIEDDVWVRVREIAKSNNPIKDPKGRIETVAPLKGILRCGHCDGAMMPTYGLKKGKKYFYYVCSRDEHRVIKQCPVNRVSAGEVEKAVLSQIRIVLQSDLFMQQCASKLGIEKSEVFSMLDPINEFWDEMAVGERYRLMVLLVEKAEILNESLEIELKIAGIKNLIREVQNAKS
jgi:site-specific DNA recombinase